MEKSIIVNENIHVDQIGYRPGDIKVAIINGIGGSFNIVSNETGETIFTGEACGAVEDESSGDTVYYADFTEVTSSGVYYIDVPGHGRSCVFRIDRNVYKEIKISMLKAIYLQRCGIELEEKHAGQWKHPICHEKMAYLYSSPDKMLDCTGGWHNAGDYGKYTVPTAKSLADLMLVYEFFPEAFRETINIPESGNGVPDVLNEARYGLEWLLKMQDSESGGVYHKVSTCGYPAMNVMPQDDKEDLYISPISSTATADFAAVAAIASRVYSKIDNEFAQKCLMVAEKAWKWVESNYVFIEFSNPPGIITGEHRDDDDRDERFWAAAELFRTTGKKEYNDYFRSAYYEYFRLAYQECFNSESKEYFSPSYHQYFETSYRYKKYDKYGLGWEHVGGYAAIAYLFADKRKVDEVVYEGLKKEYLNIADDLVKTSKIEGYRISLGVNEYWWGSNSNVLSRAIHLIISNVLNPHEEYILVAQDHLHYILGRNALDQCYVTGFGHKHIMNLHHRPSVGDGIEEPLPGMVLGGPNDRMQDQYSVTHFDGMAPARCFADVESGWSMNQMAVYWNTPAVFVVAYFDRD